MSTGPVLRWTAFLAVLLSSLLLAWTLGLQAEPTAPAYSQIDYPLTEILSPVPFAWTPQRFRNFFRLSGAERLGQGGQGSTIAFIEAPRSFDPGAWRRFNQRFDSGEPDPLPSVVRVGAAAPPSAAAADETMLDVEWAHVVAPLAHLVVVEAGNGDLTAAVERAAALHPTAISITIGRTFPYSAHLVRTGSDFAIEQVARTVPVFAASGDSRNSVSEFDALPDVVTVGGVSAEWVYNGANPRSGSGYAWFTTPQPPWQQGIVKSAWRAYPDVSWIMDFPSVVVATRDGWSAAGGTSLSTPLWAALWALGNQARLRGPYHASLPPDPNAILYALARRDRGVFLPSGGNWTAPSGLGEPNPTRLVSNLRTLRPAAEPQAPFPLTPAFGALVEVLSLLLPVGAALLLLRSGPRPASVARYAATAVLMLVPPIAVRSVYIWAGNSPAMAGLQSPAFESPGLMAGWILLYALAVYRLADWLAQ